MTVQTQETTRERTPFSHFYVWRCVESTEVRGSGGGSRAREYGKEPRARIPACGMANIRRTKQPIDQQHRPQAQCEHCGRRPRLNAGMVEESDARQWEYFEERTTGTDWRAEGGWMRGGVLYRSRSRTGAPDIEARREWAETRRDAINEALLSIRSNTLEHPAESFEQGGEILE